MSEKFTTLGEQMAAIHKAQTTGEVDPRLTAVSAEQGWDNFSRAFHYRPSKRGEWRLPDPPALIGYEFTRIEHVVFGEGDIVLRYTARYEGISDNLAMLIYATNELLRDSAALREVQEGYIRMGEREAQARLFYGDYPRPPFIRTRKAKRLHRAAMRLYKWKKKWAERRV